MFSRWQFYSDTNAANFADDLHAAGVRFTTTGDSVTIPDTPDWAYTLAHSYSGEDVTTGGLMPAHAWVDTQSTAIRSSPPGFARGDPPPDYAAQIVSQRASTFPQRRRTRSQP